MENKKFNPCTFLAKVQKCLIFFKGYNDDDDDDNDTHHHQSSRRLRPLGLFHLQGKSSV
jgi:hypothetical protein